MKNHAFGPALRAVLIENGIAESQFASRCGLDAGNLSTMLSGRGREPALPTLRRIIRELPDSVDVRALILQD